MKYITRKAFVLFTVLFLASTLVGAQVFIPSINKNISYMGRIGHTDSTAEIYWTGSSATIKVKATHEVKALLADGKGITTTM